MSRDGSARSWLLFEKRSIVRRSKVGSCANKIVRKWKLLLLNTDSLEIFGLFLKNHSFSSSKLMCITRKWLGTTGSVSRRQSLPSKRLLLSTVSRSAANMKQKSIVNNKMPMLVSRSKHSFCSCIVLHCRMNAVTTEWITRYFLI